MINKLLIQENRVSVIESTKHWVCMICKTARAVHFTKPLPEQARVNWYAHVLWDFRVFAHELAICFLLQLKHIFIEYYCLRSLLLGHQAEYFSLNHYNWAFYITCTLQSCYITSAQSSFVMDVSFLRKKNSCWVGNHQYKICHINTLNQTFININWSATKQKLKNQQYPAYSKNVTPLQAIQ